MKVFLSLTFLCLLLHWISGAEDFHCGEKQAIARPYGKIERRVDCTLTKGRKSVMEFKGDKLYGSSIGYDSSSGRKIDSCFYINDEEEGLSLVWDALGNVISRATYHKGKYVGKRESYYAPGHLALIKNYNKAGKEEGLWQEWWKNGNKKTENVSKNGQIISGIQYYQTGKPRVKYLAKYDPKNRNVFKIRRIEAEAWAPNGKSTGKIVNGNGEWIVFPDEEETSALTLFHEVYKDSLMIKAEKLDSAEIAKWIQP